MLKASGVTSGRPHPKYSSTDQGRFLHQERAVYKDSQALTELQNVDHDVDKSDRELSY